MSVALLFALVRYFQFILIVSSTSPNLVFVGTIIFCCSRLVCFDVSVSVSRSREICPNSFFLSCCAAFVVFFFFRIRFRPLLGFFCFAPGLSVAAVASFEASHVVICGCFNSPSSVVCHSFCCLSLDGPVFVLLSPVICSSFCSCRVP